MAQVAEDYEEYRWDMLSADMEGSATDIPEPVPGAAPTLMASEPDPNAAEATLAAALEDPERWGTRDLHVEIETYTWDVLPGPARGAGDLVDGLEREYRAALSVLERAGWRTG